MEIIHTWPNAVISYNPPSKLALFQTVVFLPMYVIRNLSKSIKIQIVYHSLPKHVKSDEFVQIQNQKAGMITALSTLTGCQARDYPERQDYW
jgi:hypothetical protein